MIEPWIPAFAGMTERVAGMTEKAVGMTEKIEIAALLSVARNDIDRRDACPTGINGSDESDPYIRNCCVLINQGSQLPLSVEGNI